MRDTLRHLLNTVATAAERDAFIDSRSYLDGEVMKSEFDKIMEDELAQRVKHRELVATRQARHGAPANKRVELMQCK